MKDLGKDSSYIKFIEQKTGIPCNDVLCKIFDNHSSDWGFNYEIGSKIEQYYSNVHATVFLNLYSISALDKEQIDAYSIILYKLRDDNLLNNFTKSNSDRYAWDTIEGPNVFSTALAIYTLCRTRRYDEDLIKSIEWLINERNDTGLWGYRKGDLDSYVITLYVTLAFKEFLKIENKPLELREIILTLLGDISSLLGKRFVEKGLNCYIGSYDKDGPCFSNTISGLIILKTLDSKIFDKIFRKARYTINSIIRSDDNWIFSLLNQKHYKDQIKVMYTYNPAYLPALLDMGYSYRSQTVLILLDRLIKDLKSYWNNRTIIYPWKSSDSIIQSFIASLSLYSVVKWFSDYISNYADNVNINKVNVRDIFICHASEDKTRYTKKLNVILLKSDISTWYDEGQMLWGDNISEKINDGIKDSKLAIICFSKNFLMKKWPEYEFSAIFNKQMEEGRKVILPLILNSEEECIEKYQLLKGISYKIWNSKKIDNLINEVRVILDKN